MALVTIVQTDSNPGLPVATSLSLSDVIPFVDVSEGITKSLTFTLLKAGLGIDPAGAQPLDADLTAIAALTSAADKVPYATGAGAWTLATFTAAGRAVVAAADAAAQRVVLGVDNIPTTDLGFANNSNAGSKIAVVAQFLGPSNGGATYTGSDTVSLADIQAMANHLDILTAKFQALFQALIQNKLPGVSV